MSDEKNSQDGGQRYLAFSLGEEEYAIPLLSVREVIAPPKVTSFPLTPPHFLGIMNLRGQVISVIDLRQKIGAKPKPGAENSVIICNVGATQLGCLVDSVNAVLSPTADLISEPPQLQGSRSVAFVSSVFRNDDKLILLIDLDAALSSEDRKVITQSQSTQSKGKAA